MLRHQYFWVVIIFAIFSFTSDTDQRFLPKGTKNQEITHQYYTASYVKEFKQSEWVAYEITTETAFGSTKRSNSFKEDKKANDVKLKPFYNKSGYDRGHLCPAGSMAFNSTAMKESFFMTNMSPQEPSFNRGIWKKLESQVRTWGYQNKHIYVVTGPILTEFQDTIGPIPVPKYFYKVVLDYTEPEFKAIGIIMENASSKLPLTHFVVSIDSVEKLTGINFFSELPDSLETVLESLSKPELWSWKPLKSVKQISNSSNTKSFQCIATTGAGSQCSRTVLDSNSFCWQHQPSIEIMVWVCGKSKIYHTSKTHSSLERCKSEVKEISLTKAIELGLRECKCKN